MTSNDEAERLRSVVRATTADLVYASGCNRVLRDERDAARAAHDRLLADVRGLADSLLEQGDEHVTGCMGQADCAACVAADLRALVARHASEGSEE